MRRTNRRNNPDKRFFFFHKWKCTEKKRRNCMMGHKSILFEIYCTTKGLSDGTKHKFFSSLSYVIFCMFCLCMYVSSNRRKNKFRNTQTSKKSFDCYFFTFFFSFEIYVVTFSEKEYVRGNVFSCYCSSSLYLFLYENCLEVVVC